jgi:hypothetical protein
MAEYASVLLWLLVGAGRSATFGFLFRVDVLVIKYRVIYDIGFVLR